jgi:hypothetical protein
MSGMDHMFIPPERPLDPIEVKRSLERALGSESADEIDRAVLSAFQLDELPPEFAPTFVRLLAVGSHHKHEDLVGALQKFRDPDAVDALFSAATARHEYLDYDEFFGLARKCTWALADIGTSRAKTKLEELALSENQLVAGYAKKRLDRWEDEEPRKNA